MDILSLFSIFFQVIYNIEICRYTLYSGEPIFTGKFRLLPGPVFWLVVYLTRSSALVFGQYDFNLASIGRVLDIWPRAISGCAASRPRNRTSSRTLWPSSMKRLAEPSEIADLVVFLASARVRFYTGCARRYIHLR